MAGPGTGCRLLLGAVLAATAFSGSPAAAAPPTVTEFTGGVAGFSANGGPLQIATGPDGNLWFTTEVDPGRVVRISPAGAATEFTGGVSGFTANAGPTGIALGPDGNVWFTLYKNPGRVVRITPTGAVTEFTAGGPGFTANGEPVGIAAGPDGNLWFTQQLNPGRVGRITPSGVASEFTGGVTPGFSANGFPLRIAAGPDGNVWFTEQGDPGRVGRITPSGVVTEFTGGVTPGFSPNGGPTGITTGPDGNIWFTQYKDPGRVVRMTPTGVVTEFTGGVTPGFSPNGKPTSIAVGPDGNLWFTEQSNPGRIARITPSGVVSEFTGGVTPGFSPNSFPTGITGGPDGNIWFLEQADPGRVARMPVGPRVTTGSAEGIGPDSATLTGAVAPNGQTTTYRFEYGSSTGYGSRTADAPLAASLEPTSVAIPVGGLQPDTQYHFRLMATNDSDTTIGVDATFTTASASVQATLSRLSRLAISPLAFPAASSGPSARGAGRRRRTGAQVTFRLNLAASVRFTVERRTVGRRVRSRCVARSRRNQRARRCVRYVRVRGSFTRAGDAGANAFRFTGRMARRKLRPGRYRLAARPTAAGRVGNTRRAPFRIVP